MKAEYADWIAWYVKQNGGSVRCMCWEGTTAMCRKFHELRSVEGHVIMKSGHRVEHFWCVDPDGNVVDPTESQFEAIASYEPWKPGTEVRVGRCMWCGDDIYRAVQSLNGARVSFCSPECEKLMVDDLNRPYKDD